MAPQRIHADERIEADRGRVALGFGPLVYNVESADQDNIEKPLSASPLKAVWRGDLLGGVVTIAGKWQDGTTMLAIPNFARMNRIGGATRDILTGDGSINYAPGASSSGETGSDEASKPGNPRIFELQSQVWIKDLG